MKRKRVAMFLSVGIILYSCIVSYALETSLKDMEGKIRAELVQVKALMPKNDPILVNNMYNSCLIAKTQLDAYFYMLTLFNTIEEKALGDKAVDTLIEWLLAMKKINVININALRDTSKVQSPATKVRMEKLKALFEELNKEIDINIAKVSLIKKSLPLRSSAPVSQ